MQENTSHSVRLSAYYFAVFLVAGVHLPYWPVWLTDRGLSASDIGLLAGIAMLLRVITGPLIALASDRAGRRRTQIVLFTICLGGSFSLFYFTYSFSGILLVTLLTTTLIAIIMPLIDTMTMAQYTERRVDYGRVRLWGSISFIGASAGGGWFLARAGSSIILPLVLSGCAVAIIAAFLLPRETTQPPGAPPQRANLRMALQLFRDRHFQLFVIAGSLLQASHSVYHTFGTLNWQRLGIGGTVIGLLWAVGVIAEIILFALSPRVMARFGPASLLVLGGVAGVIRWTIVAFDPPLALLFPLQILHAFTFGAVHLAAMHFINQAVPPHLAVTAQGVYAALSIGIVTGIVTYGSGFAYTMFDSFAYLGMALACGAGGLCALQLRRSWTGEKLM